MCTTVSRYAHVWDWSEGSIPFHKYNKIQIKVQIPLKPTLRVQRLLSADIICFWVIWFYSFVRFSDVLFCLDPILFFVAGSTFIVRWPYLFISVMPFIKNQSAEVLKLEIAVCRWLYNLKYNWRLQAPDILVKMA